jgi:ubiquitin-protein ligase
MANQLSILSQKRLMGDMRQLRKDPLVYIDTHPDPNNALIWHFLIKGPSDSDYAGGYYIGRMELAKEYPLKPPNFYMCTPNGRFTINKQICLSNSGFHTDEWKEAWTIRSILDGLLSIMLEEDDAHSISHIKMTKQDRKTMAQNSIAYNIANYPIIIKKFTKFLDENGQPKN